MTVFQTGDSTLTSTGIKHTLTLGQIRAASPCKSGWVKLLAGLGYTDGHYDAARQITIGDVAVINGREDAIWCFRLVDDSRLRVRAIMPAVERAARYTTDARVHKCIVLLHEWLDGADDVDLRTAGGGARKASRADARTWDAAVEVNEAAYAVAMAAYVVVGATDDVAGRAEAAWEAAGAGEAAAEAAAAATWDEADMAWAARTAERAEQVNDLIALFGRSEWPASLDGGLVKDKGLI